MPSTKFDARNLPVFTYWAGNGDWTFYAGSNKSVNLQTNGPSVSKMGLK